MKYVLVLVLMLSSLYADRDGGPYIGLGYGTSQYHDDELNIPKNLTKDKSDTVNITFGAYINKYFSVELNYADFGLIDEYKIDDTQSLEFYSVTVNTLAHYAFYDDILDFYFKFGVGEIRERNVDAKGFAFVTGVGSAIRFSEWLSLKIAYDRYSFGYDENGDDSSDYDLVINHIYTALEFQF